jgi:hypothetical protein
MFHFASCSQGRPCDSRPCAAPPDGATEPKVPHRQAYVISATCTNRDRPTTCRTVLSKHNIVVLYGSYGGLLRHNDVAGTVLFPRHSPRAARTCARVSTRCRKARPTTRPGPTACRYVPGRVTSHCCGLNLHTQGTLRSFLRVTQKSLRSRSPSRPSSARYPLAPAPTGQPKVCAHLTPLPLQGSAPASNTVVFVAAAAAEEKQVAGPAHPHAHAAPHAAPPKPHGMYGCWAGHLPYWQAPWLTAPSADDYWQTVEGLPMRLQQ